MRIAFIGFGEVGGIFARDLRAAGHDVRAAFDPAFADPASKASRNLVASGIPRADSAPDVARDAEVVFCCVTAGSALGAAQSLASGLGHAPFVVDVNSVSPARSARRRRPSPPPAGAMWKPR